MNGENLLLNRLDQTTFQKVAKSLIRVERPPMPHDRQGVGEAISEFMARRSSYEATDQLGNRFDRKYIAADALAKRPDNTEGTFIEVPAIRELCKLQDHDDERRRSVPHLVGRERPGIPRRAFLVNLFQNLRILMLWIFLAQ